jgi:pimeloyl-ACP methyl ester carboxylesterase
MILFRIFRTYLLAIAGPFVASALAAGANAQTSTPDGVRNVVLVHGAWADGSSWSKLIPLLQAEGLHVVAVQNPLTSLADDVAARQSRHRMDL